MVDPESLATDVTSFFDDTSATLVLSAVEVSVAGALAVDTSADDVSATAAAATCDNPAAAELELTGVSDVDGAESD